MMIIDQEWISEQRKIGDALAQAAAKARQLNRSDLLEEIDQLSLCVKRKEVASRLSDLARKLEFFRKNASEPT